MKDILEEFQDSIDNVSLLAKNQSCPVRDADPKSPREEKLISEFRTLQKWVNGKADLKIIEGDCSSYYHTGGRVAINLRQIDNLAVGLSDNQRDTIDLYVLAHECGHLGQYTLTHQRYIQATKREKEGCADYIAGVWLGIRLGQNLPIDPAALAQIAFSLRGGGDGPDQYPYQEQRRLLVSYGKSNSATQQLTMNTLPSSLSRPLTSKEFTEMWDASDHHI